MSGKRGQDASAIATLVITIGLVIVLFVLLLPQAEREKLISLEDENETGDVDENGKILKEGTVLLAVAPGRIFPKERKEFYLSIPPTRLFSRVQADRIRLENFLGVSTGLFSKKAESLFFNLKNVDTIEGAQLFFFVQDASGKLRIELNGNQLFDGEIEKRELPIQVPLRYLKESNLMEFSTHGGFFGSQYDLSDIYLKLEQREERTQTSKTFQLTKGEAEGITKARLEYFINCFQLREEGVVSITLNGRPVTTDVASCDAGLQTIGLNVKDLRQGANVLEFEITRGDYRLDDMEIHAETKEEQIAFYNFDITEDQYEDVQDDEKEVLVILRFEDDEEELKEYTMEVNGEKIIVKTRLMSDRRDVSNLLERGVNSIKILPEDSFEVLDLS